MLLAVDLGMKLGLAWFGEDGRLVRARSTRFPNRATLKRALPAIWEEMPGVTHVVLEGGGDLADLWRKSALKHGLSTETITAEEWRQEVLAPSQMRSGKQAKAVAEEMALQIARDSDVPPKTELGNDTAEAILFGDWYWKNRYKTKL